jgi:26S proteasome regulatory subunit N9
MRAMSLGLLKGSLDEVSSTVHISYVKPRVLDTTQIAALKTRLEGWNTRVQSTLRFLEENTTELLA